MRVAHAISFGLFCLFFPLPIFALGSPIVLSCQGSGSFFLGSGEPLTNPDINETIVIDLDQGTVAAFPSATYRIKSTTKTTIEFGLEYATVTGFAVSGSGTIDRVSGRASIFATAQGEPTKPVHILTLQCQPTAPKF